MKPPSKSRKERAMALLALLPEDCSWSMLLDILALEADIEEPPELDELEPPGDAPLH
jgi:hypothetical protein